MLRRRLELVAAVLAIATAPANALSQGFVGVYADPQGDQCAVNVGVPGQSSFYVVHTLAYSTTAVRFRSLVPACSGVTWLSDTPRFPVNIGNSQAGITVYLGACQSGSIHVLTINASFATAPPNCCCWYTDASPDAVSGRVEIMDCSVPLPNVVPIAGQMLMINEVYPGMCERPCVLGGGWGCINAPAPTAAATWGAIKALYVGSG